MTALSHGESLERQNAALTRDLTQLLAVCNEVADLLGFDRDAVSPQDLPNLVRESLAAPADHGLELALTLARDQLTPIASTLLVVRHIFDCDESPTSFELRHNPWCPDHELAGTGNRGTCACGLYTTLERLKDACHDLEQVKVALDRCIQSLSEEGRP